MLRAYVLQKTRERVREREREYQVARRYYNHHQRKKKKMRGKKMIVSVTRNRSLIPACTKQNPVRRGCPSTIEKE